jgi:hypothetical protein
VAGGRHNNSATDFIVEGVGGDHFYITDPDWKHLKRAVVQGQDTTPCCTLCCRREGDERRFSYTRRIVQQGAMQAPSPRRLPLQHRRERAHPLPPPPPADTTLLNLAVRAGDLRRRERHHLMFNSNNGWQQFDFHRLDTHTVDAACPAGSFFYLR